MRTLLVFLKYPVAGQVKTRLAEAVGQERAAQLYRQWIEIVFAQMQPTRHSTRVVACYDGAAQEAFGPWHASADEWWPQAGGDLGARLDAAFKSCRNDGLPALAIGTDCLDLAACHVEAAFEALQSRDAVFGPAADGGYYLVGLAGYLPGFFSGIPWSTAATLEAHLSLCNENGWSFGLLSPLADIDTLEDYEQYQRHRKGEP